MLSGSLTSLGLMPNMMSAACIVTLTAPGGVFMALTSSMSPFFSLSRHSTAFSAMALVSAASLLALASSCSTTILVSAAEALSLSICTIMAATLICVSASTGCMATMSSCSLLTMPSVEMILSRPFCRRSRIVPHTSRCLVSTLRKVDSSSRYEVGVT